MTPAQFRQYMEQLPAMLVAAHGGGGAAGGAAMVQPGAGAAAVMGQLGPCHLGRDKMKRYKKWGDWLKEAKSEMAFIAITANCQKVAYIRSRSRSRRLKQRELEYQVGWNQRSRKKASAAILRKDGQLFNSLPPYLRNMRKCSVEIFKEELDKYLMTIPDEPSVPGLTPAATTPDARPSNSLLHQRPLQLPGREERRGRTRPGAWEGAWQNQWLQSGSWGMIARNCSIK